MPVFVSTDITDLNAFAHLALKVQCVSKVSLSHKRQSKHEFKKMYTLVGLIFVILEASSSKTKLKRKHIKDAGRQMDKQPNWINEH